MKFSDEVEKIQKENLGSVILVKNGIFFIGIGKDAIILNKELGLKLTCMRTRVCKVGFLVKDAEKYIQKMKDKDISFQMYIIDVKKESIEKLIEYQGKEMLEEYTCLECDKCARRKDTEEDIIERLRNIGK